MLYYNSQKIIPASFVEIRKEVIEAQDGTVLDSVFRIILTGKIVATKGSPNSSGVFWNISGYPPDEELTADQRLSAILRKQEALMRLFGEDGKSLEIQGWDGAAPLKCNPRIKGITFAQGQWFDVCDYTIECEADLLYLDGVPIGTPSDYRISQASNEWNIEPTDDTNRVYRLTHSVSATGKRFYDETGTLVMSAWEQAKAYVLEQIGLGLNPDRLAADDVLNADDLQAFNYVRTNTIDELGGSFSVTETWLGYNPQGEAPAIDDFAVDVRFSEDGRTSVSISGQITGLEVRDNNTHGPAISTKWENCLSKWTLNVQPDLLARAENLSGVDLNPLPTAANYNANSILGTLSYQYEYNDRPLSMFAGSRSEVLTITNSGGTDVFARIPIIGRALGPILQDMDTITERQRSISIEVAMPGATTSYSPVQPSTDALVLSYIPNGTIVFLEQNTESWTPITGRYSRNVVYTYE
jgi:hypothetical protein